MRMIFCASFGVGDSDVSRGTMKKAPLEGKAWKADLGRLALGIFIFFHRDAIGVFVFLDDCRGAANPVAFHVVSATVVGVGVEEVEGGFHLVSLS